MHDDNEKCFFRHASIMLITLQRGTHVMENVITIQRREGEKFFFFKVS